MAEQKVNLNLPQAPFEVLTGDLSFAPDLTLPDWIEETFLNEDSILFNEDHLHLSQATIGFLWTNVLNQKQGKRIVGQAELLQIRGSKWQTERQYQQIREWFRDVTLDFLITLDANYCMEAEEVNVCALIDHELYHCGHALDDLGQPKFNKSTGRPIFAMRGHDIEEFIGIYRRYGLIDEESKEIAKLGILNKPEISEVSIKDLCGVCV